MSHDTVKRSVFRFFDSGDPAAWLVRPDWKAPKLGRPSLAYVRAVKSRRRGR